ncbi:MAG: MurR/RpiR family transcriptional regulator [Culicoidibacterales bacterium]
MKLTERIQKFEYRLNSTEDEILEFILNNQELVTSISIQTLAQKCFTAPTTIMRLVKKLDYLGFSDFKVALRKEIQTPKANTAFTDPILKTAELINYDLFRKLALTLQAANRIFFYGVGDTEYLCLLAAGDLRITFPQITTINHRHELLFLLETANPTDIVFFISLSGETKEILSLAEKAREKNVTIVSLTHFHQNKLATLTDFALYCYSPLQYLQGYNVTDKTPALFQLRTFNEFCWDFLQLNQL